MCLEAKPCVEELCKSVYVFPMCRTRPEERVGSFARGVSVKLSRMEVIIAADKVKSDHCRNHANGTTRSFYCLAWVRISLDLHWTVCRRAV